MKSVYFVRHAKSSWEYPDFMDHERPLLQKGITRTIRVCEFLKEKKVKPDVIIASHAVRASETARIIARELDYPSEKIRIEPKIYESCEDDIWSIIFELDDEVKSIMLVGHNPVITNLANYFLDKKIDYMPTSGIAGFSFITNHWVELTSAKRKTQFVVYPKMLKP